MPRRWKRYLAELPFYSSLGHKERLKLQDDARILIAEKSWEGCGGRRMTDRIKVVVAAQAALLILNLDHDFFRKVDSILVYPGTFMVPSEHQGRDGVMHADTGANLGLAAHRGPVVLSWEAVLEGARDPHDGRNVVLHEFAHKLDMLDEFADGTPPLSGREQYKAWSDIMGREYEKLCRSGGRGGVLDSYGATDPAEFFAVATECFFEVPRRVKRLHPGLYGLLSRYYRQDPASRSAS